MKEDSFGSNAGEGIGCFFILLGIAIVLLVFSGEFIEVVKIIVGK